MTTPRIDATLSAEDQSDIMAAIETIQQKLPFLTTLSPKERKRRPEITDQNEVFITKALDVARQNEAMLPRSFHIEEMQQDATLYETLRTIKLALHELQEMVDDTTLTVGGEAFTAGQLVYHYARANNWSDGLEEVLNEQPQQPAGKSKKEEAAPAKKEAIPAEAG